MQKRKIVPAIFSAGSMDSLSFCNRVRIISLLALTFLLLRTIGCGTVKVCDKMSRVKDGLFHTFHLIFPYAEQAMKLIQGGEYFYDN